MSNYEDIIDERHLDWKKARRRGANHFLLTFFKKKSDALTALSVSPCLECLSGVGASRDLWWFTHAESCIRWLATSLKNLACLTGLFLASLSLADPAHDIGVFESSLPRLSVALFSGIFKFHDPRSGSGIDVTNLYDEMKYRRLLTIVWRKVYSAY